MSVLGVRPERANLTIGHLYHERATEDPRIYNARWSKHRHPYLIKGPNVIGV